MASAVREIILSFIILSNFLRGISPQFSPIYFSKWHYRVAMRSTCRYKFTLFWRKNAARVAKLVDARDLKSLGLRLCGFESRPEHHISYIPPVLCINCAARFKGLDREDVVGKGCYQKLFTTRCAEEHRRPRGFSTIGTINKLNIQH